MCVYDDTSPTSVPADTPATPAATTDSSVPLADPGTGTTAPSPTPIMSMQAAIDKVSPTCTAGDLANVAVNNPTTSYNGNSVTGTVDPTHWWSNTPSILGSDPTGTPSPGMLNKFDQDMNGGWWDYYNFNTPGTLRYQELQDNAQNEQAQAAQYRASGVLPEQPLQDQIIDPIDVTTAGVGGGGGLWARGGRMAVEAGKEIGNSIFQGVTGQK